jgi:hypothetical protein
MNDLTVRLRGRLLRRFWISVSPALAFLALDVIVHQSHGSVTPPVGSIRLWGVTLLIVAAGLGVALPILLRSLFHDRARKQGRVDPAAYERHEKTVMTVSIAAAWVGALAYLFPVQGLHLYGSVLAGLYGIYSAIPSSTKLSAQMRYYGLLS